MDAVAIDEVQSPITERAAADALRSTAPGLVLGRSARAAAGGVGTLLGDIAALVVGLLHFEGEEADFCRRSAKGTTIWGIFGSSKGCSEPPSLTSGEDEEDSLHPFFPALRHAPAL